MLVGTVEIPPNSASNALKHHSHGVPEGQKGSLTKLAFQKSIIYLAFIDWCKAYLLLMHIAGSNSASDREQCVKSPVTGTNPDGRRSHESFHNCPFFLSIRTVCYPTLPDLVSQLSFLPLYIHMYSIPVRAGPRTGRAGSVGVKQVGWKMSGLDLSLDGEGYTTCHVAISSW